MLPVLVPGEQVRVRRRVGRLHAGDVVAVLDPRDRTTWLIKRVVMLESGLVELGGDNSEFSTDSRHFGPVRLRDVNWVARPRATYALRRD